MPARHLDCVDYDSSARPPLLPQLDYPYPIGSMPGWPVNASCHRLVAAMGSRAGLVAAAANITKTVNGSPEFVKVRKTPS